MGALFIPSLFLLYSFFIPSLFLLYSFIPYLFLLFLIYSFLYSFFIPDQSTCKVARSMGGLWVFY